MRYDKMEIYKPKIESMNFSHSFELRHYITPKGKKLYNIVGLDYGYGAKIILIKESENYYLFRVSGRSNWTGLGETSYTPPEYLIYKKVGNNKVEDICYCEYTKESKKEATRLINEKWEELQSLNTKN